MASLGDLFVRVGADIGDFQSGMGEVTRTTNKISKDMGSIANTLGSAGTALTAGLTLPLVGAAGAALKFAQDFNAGLANIATLIPNSTARVKELGTSIQQIAIDVGKNTTDISNGMYQVISAFGDGADSIKILEINAKAATAGLATTTDAINLTSAVTKGYGDTSADAVQKVSDLAFIAVQLGQTTFPELAASIGRVVPLSAELKVSQEELFGVMATATGVTGGAAEVSTQLRGVLQSLLAPTDSMKSLMNSLGFESGNAMIEQLGLKGSLDAVKGAVASSGEPLQKYVTSIEGQTLALALTGAQSDVYVEKLGAMSNATGATETAFEAQTKGINAAGFAFNQLKVKAEVMAQKFGDALVPIMQKFLDNVLVPLVSKIETAVDWFNKLDGPMQTIILTALGLAAAIGPVLLAVSGVASGLSSLIALPGILTTGLGILKTAFVTVGGSITGVAAPALGVIAPIVAGIVAAFALWKLAEWAYNNFEPFKKLVDEVFTFAKTLVEGFIQLAILQFNLFKAALVYTWDALKMVGDWFLGLPAVQTIITTFKDVAANAFNWIADKVKFMNDAMGAFLEVIKKVNGSTDDLKTKSNAAAEAQQKQAEEAAKQKKEADELAAAIKKQKEWLDALLAGQKDNTSQYKEQKKESEKTKKETKELSDEYKIMVAQLDKVTPSKKKLIDSIASLKTSIENVKDPQATMLEDLKKLTAETTAMTDGTTALATLAPPAWLNVGNAASESVQKIDAAYKTLGITSTETLNKAATDAQTAYTTIKDSGIASANDILAAEKSAMDARLTYLKSIGGDLTTEEKARYTELENALPTHLNTQKTAWEGYKNSVSTTITNMAQDIGKTLFDGDLSWAEKGKKVLGSLASGFTSLFIEPATEAINGFISGALKSLLSGDGLGGIMTSLTNIGAKITGIFGSAGGAASGAAGSAGGAAGSVGGVGGAASGVVGTIGAIGSIGSMVSGIIGNFQMAGMNKTLDLIEWNTRKSSLHLQDIFTPIYDFTNDFRNRWMGGLGIYNQEGDSGIRLAPYEFNGGSIPVDIQAGLGEMLTLVGEIKNTPRTVNFTINGVTNPKEVADIVLNRLAEELG